MKKPVRLALFGVGLIGRRHLTIAAEEPGCKVVAAADVMTSARQEVEAHGVRFYSNHQELLEREHLDGIIIATSNDTHAELGIDCIALGLPLLVEKPLTDTLASGRALVEAAQTAGVPLAVGHHRRFDPSVALAKSMIEAGTLGQLTAIQVIWALRKHDDYYETKWRISRATGGGLSLINLIHDLDLMRYFAGEIERVYAELGKNIRGFQVEDRLTATIRFQSGGLGSLMASDATPSPWGWEQGSGENPGVPQTGHNCYRLLGTEGALALPRLELYRHEEEHSADWRSPVKIKPLAHGPRAALQAQLAHFCAVVRGEVSPRVNGHDGYASLAATLALIRAGETGEVTYPESVNKQ